MSGPCLSSLTPSLILKVVYNDASRRPDPSAFSKFELWHTDVDQFIGTNLYKSNVLIGFIRAPAPKHHLFEDAYRPRIRRRHSVELRVGVL